MSGFRKAYSIFGVLLMVELALQFYLIAAAALNVWGADNNKDTSGSVFSGFKTGDNFAMAHQFNGSLVIPVTILILIGLSFGARLPRRTKWQTAGLFGLMVIQLILAGFGSSGGAALAAVGGLHGVNALLIVGLAGMLLYRNWAYRATPAAATAPAPPLSTSALEAER